MIHAGKAARRLLAVSVCVLAALHAAVSCLGVSSPASQWRSAAGYRWAELPKTGPGRPGFARLPRGSTGLGFTNLLDELSGAANRVLYNGAGVAAGDIDNDGYPDVFLCDLSGNNGLFRNLGNWRFTNVTASAGLRTNVPGTRGAVLADLNGDGALDLLTTATGRGVFCYLNDGKGGFRDATAASGITGNPGSTSLALADVDGNGTLDLYVVNYRPEDIRDRGRVTVSMVNGRPVMAGSERTRFAMVNGRLEECGQADQLLLNDGSGRFQAVSWTNGVFLDEDGRPLAEAPVDWGLTAMFQDVNGDLAPDLYVCNDYWTPDRFWINDGRGRFRAAPRQALRKTSASSMSVDFADIDRDGAVDFFVVDMLSRYPHMRKRQSLAQMPMGTPVGVTEDRPQVMRNTLFLNRQDGTFAEIAGFANLSASDWSWAPLFMDVDLDGFPDLLIGAGHFRDVQDYDAEERVRARQHSWQGFKSEAERQKAFTRELMENFRLYPLLQMPIGAFRNQGNCQFAEVTADWGLNHPGIHQGLALADFDRDGDLDLVVNSLNEAAMLFRNDSPAGRVMVRLNGRAPNTQAIGARVSLHGGAAPRQTTEIVAGGHYQSGSDTEAVFAVGNAAGVMTLEVRWRGGGLSVIDGVQAGRIYEVDEGGSRPASTTAAAALPGVFFEDASQRLGHKHPELVFNDFERQGLLPFKLSQLGPGVAWFDLDGDEHEDLIVGSGRGGSLSVFRSDGRGGFAALPGPPAMVVSNDLAGVVAWTDTGGKREILAASTGYETKGGCGLFRFTAGNDSFATPLPAAVEMNSAGALALGDMSGDGRLALFAGGGVLPGQYPLSSPSKIYRLEGGKWVLDGRNSNLFQNLGIVNSAVWSDLDGDGIPELVLACEWGPIRVFRNRSGSLFEVTGDLGLQPFVGWWRGVTAGDLNNDGRLDLIASNWGLNSQYRASERQPLVFAYGQIAEPGIMEVIETEYAGDVLAPSRQFMDMANALPFLRERFRSHKAYSEANLEEVLGERKVLARRAAATTLASMAFLNTGKGFRAVELPREAQFSPAFSVNVADFDGDGCEDVFLSQNFFGLQPQAPRIDAGLGLWLRGDGEGGLAAVPASRSGVRVFGEQRGAAVADYDEDGRVDLVVSQNGAETKLYRNVGAKPGLRVKLRGLPGNPGGIGAVLRLQYKDRQGPCREVHAGSGYWSQDSPTQVLAMPGQPESLWIRWPGGRTTTTPLSPGSKEVTIDLEGRRIVGR